MQENKLLQKKIKTDLWEDILDFYIGQCGILPDIFWCTTFNENIRLSEAFQIKQNLEWDRVRYLSTMLINVNVGKASKRIQPQKLFKLPHDKPSKVKGKKYQEKEMLDFKKMVEDSQKKQKSKKG